MFDTVHCDNQVVQLVAVTIDSFKRADVGNSSFNDAAEMGDTTSRRQVSDSIDSKKVMAVQYYDDWTKAYADAAIPQFVNYIVIDQIMRRHFPDMDQPNKFAYFGVYRDKHVNVQIKVLIF